VNTKPEIYLSIFLFYLFTPPFSVIDFFMKHVYLLEPTCI